MGSGDVLLGLCVLQRRLHSRQGSATHEGEAEHIVLESVLHPTPVAGNQKLQMRLPEPAAACCSCSRR